jgi:hypothetical protein
MSEICRSGRYWLTCATDSATQQALHANADALIIMFYINNLHHNDSFGNTRRRRSIATPRGW